LDIQCLKIQFDSYSTFVQLLSLAKAISIGNPASMAEQLGFDNSALFMQGLLHPEQALRVPIASLP